MHIAMLGTRGVPASYGGFETAAEEVGARLVERGHDVTVYGDDTQPDVTTYRGMRVVHVPALRLKQAETLSRTGLATLRAMADDYGALVVLDHAGGGKEEEDDERKPRSNLRHPGRTLGDDHEVDDQQHAEDDKTKENTSPHDEIGKPLNHVARGAGAGMPLANDQLGRGDIEREPQHE